MYVGHPIFFDAAVDTLCIPSRAFYDERRPYENAWYQLLLKTPSHLLDSVKFLDILDVDCLHKLGQTLRLITGGGDVDLLIFFTGLEEVGISPNTEYDDASLPDGFETWEEVANEVVGCGKEVFEWRLSRGCVNKVPRIVLRPAVYHNSCR